MTDRAMSLLPDRAVLTIAGGHRLRLLEGLLTSSVIDLTAGTLRMSALLTPQGKVVTDMMIFAYEDYLQLDVAAATADDLVRRLTMYRLRADVAIERTDEVVAVDPNATTEGGWVDPRGEALGRRMIRESAPRADDVIAAYHAARIAHGFAETVTDYPPSEMFPHDVNMDLSGAVNFAKGCFVGQEVVSRMRHRGTARRRTVVARADGALPPPGTPVTSLGKPVGVMGSSAAGIGLAIVRIDRTGRTAEADGVALTLAVPPQAPFALAGDLSEA